MKEPKSKFWHACTSDNTIEDLIEGLRTAKYWKEDAYQWRLSSLKEWRENIAYAIIKMLEWKGIIEGRESK